MFLNQPTHTLGSSVAEITGILHHRCLNALVSMDIVFENKMCWKRWKNPDFTFIRVLFTFQHGIWCNSKSGICSSWAEFEVLTKFLVAYWAKLRADFLANLFHIRPKFQILKKRIQFSGHRSFFKITKTKRLYFWFQRTAKKAKNYNAAYFCGKGNS